YSGRPRELLGAVRGLLSNPNCEFPLNHVPVRTLGEFVHGTGSWDARAAYLRAVQDWSREVETVGPALDPAALTMFGDGYYLPHEEGPLADAFCRQCEELLRLPPTGPGQRERAADLLRQSAQLREFCLRLPGLRNRPLFHALHRRCWELREELDLLERGLPAHSVGGGEPTSFRSDDHLPGVYRGGLVARLQRMFLPQSDASFVAAPREPEAEKTCPDPA